MSTPTDDQHLRQVIDNIAKDKRLSDLEKQVAKAIAESHHTALNTNKNGEVTIWGDYCETAKPSLSNSAQIHSGPANARLGNIWSRRSFANAVGRQLRRDQREAERIAALCCTPKDELSEHEIEEIEEYYEQLALRESDECWLFDGPSSHNDPFDGVDLGSLSCRLGLPYRVGEEFVIFAAPPPVGTRRPCVLDADWFFQGYWRPGGLTRAFCTSSIEDGLYEWIAKPPLLKDTGGPICTGTVTDGNPTNSAPYDVT